MGPPGGDVRAIAVDPASPSTIYIAARLGGVFKSTDAGATWQAASKGLPIAHRDVLAIAVDPVAPNRVYAGLAEGGIFKTTDGGGIWRTANGNLSASVLRLPVNALAIDPTAPEYVYAGTGAGGVLRTTDGGGSWFQFRFPFGPIGPVYSIAIDPFSSANIYTVGDGGLYQSLDRGVTWRPTSQSGSFTSCAIAVSRTIPGKIYVGFASGGIRTSADGGVTWSDLHFDTYFNGRFRGVYSLAVDYELPPTLYAGTHESGLFKRTGEGPWVPAASELTDSKVNAIALGPSGAVYAGTTGQGFFRSIDGASWARSNAGLAAASVTAMAVDPRDPSVAYAALADLGVYRSRGGTSWMAAGIGSPAVPVISLGVSAVSEVYAATLSLGLLHSSDGGANWLPSGLGADDSISLALDQGQPATIYVSSALGALNRSNDGGASWTHVNGLLGLTAMAVAPGLPDTVYSAYSSWFCPAIGCGTVGYLLKTSNGGRDWIPLGHLTNITTVLVDPANPAIVYAGPRAGGGVFKSVDGGTNWTAVGADSLPFAVSALAADSNSVLYAGTPEDGVFESFDGGQSWLDISTGLADSRIVTLAVAGSLRDPTLYAGTYGRGIFRLAGLHTVSRSRNPSRVVQPRH